MLIGGGARTPAQAQAPIPVWVLAAVGSEWSQLPSMTATTCANAAAVLLPDGKVLIRVARLVCFLPQASRVLSCGTRRSRPGQHCRRWRTSEILQRRACSRAGARLCWVVMAQTARVARTARCSTLRRDNGSRCPAEMAHDHGHIPAVAPVSGGMLVAGGSSGSITELYDEVSGRWCQLPHVQMVERRRITGHGLSLGASGSSVG